MARTPSEIGDSFDEVHCSCRADNVPLINSYKWFHALRDNGVPVEFWTYPADTHFPKDIVRTTDVYKRWVGWMTQHLK